MTGDNDEPRTPNARKGVGHAGLEVAVGAASEAGDVAAIASEHVLAVAQSPGHGSGWVAARFVARAIGARFAAMTYGRLAPPSKTQTTSGGQETRTACSRRTSTIA